MNNNLKFGIREGISLIMVSICTQVFLNLPRIMIESAGTAGWMLVIYLSVIAYLVLFIILKLYPPFEGKDLLDIAEIAGGSFLRIITGIMIIIHSALILSIILREFTEDLKIIALPTSPISYVTFFFVIGMIIGAYAGIVPIVRLCSLAVPVITIGYLIIHIGMYPYYDLTRLLPLFGTGVKNIFVEGIPKVSVYSGLVFLFIIAPFLKTKENLNKVGYIGTVLSALILFISTFIYSIVAPYPASMEMFLPFYHLARIFYFGLFFQRLESVFIFIWVMAALLYLSAELFILSHVFAKTFKLKYYRPLLLPLTVLIFTFSLIPENLVSTIELETLYFRNYAWIVTFTLVPMILVVARIRLKSGSYKKIARRNR
jgi:spore germination protein KB